MTATEHRSELDDQFNLRKRHPVARNYLLLNALQSLMARYQLTSSLDVSYGDSPGQKLDIFPAVAEAAPVFVFIHGGYFRALGKSHYRYLANRMVRAGYTTVLVNYDLAPKVTVAEIIRQNLAAFTWIRRNIHQWNGDPSRITLCGHSVGAFLAAKILEEDWPGGSGLNKVALLSGLFDLEPMRQSYLNRDVRLSPADPQDLNPNATAISQDAELLVAVGADETTQFVSQSEGFSQALSQAGRQNVLQTLPGINHYTMSRLLCGHKNPVIDWIVGSSSE